MVSFSDIFDEIEEPETPPRDEKIDQAKEVLKKQFFGKGSDGVFYGRQIEVFCESEFFHWITTKALGELVSEKLIESKLMELEGPTHVRFYWSKGNRYWLRKAKEIRKIILEYSQDSVRSAVGDHAEMMFSAALPTGGFIPVGADTRSYKGKAWEKTEHEFDRIFEKDGVAYGVEIKNTLSYIERDELEVKMEMCEFLGLMPLFIMRMAPKSYIDMINKAGGYAMIFKWQLYPYGLGGLAEKVKNKLGLPADCPRRISDSTVTRFLKWHVNSLRAKDV